MIRFEPDGLYSLSELSQEMRRIVKLLTVLERPGLSVMRRNVILGLGA